MTKNSFQQNIEAQDVSGMEPVRFPGRVVIVETAEDAELAAADILSYPYVGFDTETRPSFKAGMSNKVALLQLSTPDTCYLFRLCRMALEKPIIKVLESKRTMKIGADIPNDLRGLQQLRHFKAGGFLDLQAMAADWGIAEKSVRKLSAIILGRRVSKAQRLSNWEASSLTESQCAYAATDAWVCLTMYEALQQTEKNPLPAPEPPPVKEPKKRRPYRRSARSGGKKREKGREESAGKAPEIGTESREKGNSGE